MQPRQFFQQGMFTEAGRTEFLQYDPADGNWWLGSVVETQLSWRLVGNTRGFGNLLEDHRFWVGHFGGPQRLELLFYSPGDGNWWLGRCSEQELGWKMVGNTAGFGNLMKRSFWTGNFLRSGQLDLLFYAPGDGNWWLAHVEDVKLQWTCVGNTKGFGNVTDGRPFWTGNFVDGVQTDLLFFSPADGHWWLGRFHEKRLEWALAHKDPR